MLSASAEGKTARVGQTAVAAQQNSPLALSSLDCRLWTVQAAHYRLCQIYVISEAAVAAVLAAGCARALWPADEATAAGTGTPGSAAAAALHILPEVIIMSGLVDPGAAVTGAPAEPEREPEAGPASSLHDAAPAKEPAAGGAEADHLSAGAMENTVESAKASSDQPRACPAEAASQTGPASKLAPSAGPDVASSSGHSGSCAADAESAKTPTSYSDILSPLLKSGKHVEPRIDGSYSVGDFRVSCVCPHVAVLQVRPPLATSLPSLCCHGAHRCNCSLPACEPHFLWGSGVLGVRPTSLYTRFVLDGPVNSGLVQNRRTKIGAVLLTCVHVMHPGRRVR